MVSLQVTKKNSIHFILTIFLCFFFRFLPPFGQMTEYGMGILGAFLGAIYGWSFLGMIWPSFMALSGVGLVIGMDKMLVAAFGNYTVMGMLFMFLMTAVMDEVGAMDMLVNKILGAKFMYGKPWILLCVIYFAAFIGGMYIMAILFMCAHFALATPAANPSTGMVFSYTNWVKAGSLSKYGIITVIILFIVEIVIGISFANLVF